MGPFLFEESTMTSDTFLIIIDNTALHHVFVGTIFKLRGASPPFSHRVSPFLVREIPDRGGRIPLLRRSSQSVTLPLFGTTIM
jgi:hypothetical protein